MGVRVGVEQRIERVLRRNVHRGECRGERIVVFLRLLLGGRDREHDRYRARDRPDRAPILVAGELLRSTERVVGRIDDVRRLHGARARRGADGPAEVSGHLRRRDGAGTGLAGAGHRQRVRRW